MLSEVLNTRTRGNSKCTSNGESERHFERKSTLKDAELALAIFANVGRVVIKDTNKLPLPRAGGKDGQI